MSMQMLEIAQGFFVLHESGRARVVPRIHGKASLFKRDINRVQMLTKAGHG